MAYFTQSVGEPAAHARSPALTQDIEQSSLGSPKMDTWLSGMSSHGNSCRNSIDACLGVRRNEGVWTAVFRWWPISGHLNSFPGEESRFVYDALVEHGIVDLVKAVFPKAVRLPNVGCNFNLPGSVTQHYHADRNFLDHFIIANVAVVDTDLRNGAIEVVPGTHRKFYKFWRFALERPHRADPHSDATGRCPGADIEPVASRNAQWTAEARPMLAFTWEDGGSVSEDPFAIEGGRIVFRQNWYRPISSVACASEPSSPPQLRIRSIGSSDHSMGPRDTTTSRSIALMPVPRVRAATCWVRCWAQVAVGQCA